MTSTLATTRLAVYRGGVVNAMRDEVDLDDIVPVEGLESIGASVIERTKRVQDPSSGIWRTIPYLKARINPKHDVRVGDRVRDLRDGTKMTVDAITRTARSLAGAATLTLDLTDRAA